MNEQKELLQGAGLYVHVPFCVRKCLYCDFNSGVGTAAQKASYVQAVCRELDILRQAPPAPLTYETIYVGGGTPTCLAPDALAAVLRAATAAAWPNGMPPGAEFTVEANPGTITPEHMEIMRGCGVNRLSLGVQNFDDGVLQRLGRIHSAATAHSAVRAAQAAGFAAVNIDLMFAVPGQDLAVWDASLQQAIDLGPAHISCYSLIVEPGTPLAAAVAAHQATLPDEDSELAMYQSAIATLTAAGYVHYEISNFAKPGQACRHNLNYWRNGYYMGVGPGAHSHLPGERRANAADTHVYTAAVATQASAVAERVPIDHDMAMDDTMIMGLRLMAGVDLSQFAARFGVAAQKVYAEQIHRLSAHGLVEVSQDHLRLTSAGLPIANQVFMAFLRENSA